MTLFVNLSLYSSVFAFFKPMVVLPEIDGSVDIDSFVDVSGTT